MDDRRTDDLGRQFQEDILRPGRQCDLDLLLIPLQALDLDRTSAQHAFDPAEGQAAGSAGRSWILPCSEATSILMITAGMPPLMSMLNSERWLCIEARLFSQKRFTRCSQAMVGQFAFAEAGGGLPELHQPERHEAALVVLPVLVELVLDALAECRLKLAGSARSLPACRQKSG